MLRVMFSWCLPHLLKSKASKWQKVSKALKGKSHSLFLTTWAIHRQFCHIRRMIHSPFVRLSLRLLSIKHHLICSHWSDLSSLTTGQWGNSIFPLVHSDELCSSHYQKALYPPPTLVSSSHPFFADKGQRESYSDCTCTHINIRLVYRKLSAMRPYDK